MKIYKIDEFAAILEGKQLVNGMTLDEISDKYERFKGSDRKLLHSVISLLSNTDYAPEYLEVLNRLLGDKRVRNIMRKGFGGSWGDTRIGVSEKTTVETASVIPTQNEIDMTKSLKWGLLDFKGTVDMIHKNPPMLKGVPIVTFNGKYIVDGHHRWSQIYCFNKVMDSKPTKFAAIDFVNRELDPLDILKITQTTIGLDLHPEKIVPHVTTKNPQNNLLDESCTEDIIYEYIEKNITDSCVEKMLAYHEKDGLTDKRSVMEFILKNCIEMRKDNNCIKNAPDRGSMPQTDADDELIKNIKNTSDIS